MLIYGQKNCFVVFQFFFAVFGSCVHKLRVAIAKCRRASGATSSNMSSVEMEPRVIVVRGVYIVHRRDDATRRARCGTTSSVSVVLAIVRVAKVFGPAKSTAVCQENRSDIFIQKCSICVCAVRNEFRSTHP